MIVITKIIVTPAMTRTMIYVTGRSWLLSLFDSVCGEQQKVDNLLVFTIVFVGKDIAVDRSVNIGRDIAVEYRGVDIVRELSTKNKDSYSI